MGNQTTPTFGAFSRVSARNRQTGESGRKTPQSHTAVGETAILDTISKGCSKDYLPDLRPARWLFHGPPAGSKFLAAPLKATASEKHQGNVVTNTSS